MASKGRAPEYPRTIAFGAGKVRVAKRANGWFALTWREMGSTRRTTKITEPKALEWAAKKARELDAGTGNRWIHGSDADALASLRAVAGTEEGAMRRLVEDVKGAMGWLEGLADMTTAARWYAERGPLRVQRITVAVAVKRFLAEYAKGSPATLRTFGGELNGFVEVKGNGDLLLLDLTTEKLTTWCNRKMMAGAVKAKEGKNKEASMRTVDNRITNWITFLNRCRDWGLLPEAGKHAADRIRRPTLPDAGREILTVDQGRALLAAVRNTEPELEGYLIIGGWLGLRPSEIQRLTWGAFDWERGYCHLAPITVRKTATERYVPMDERVVTLLRRIYEASGKKPQARVCRFRSREFLSSLARKAGVLDTWPADVLRHSFCSYRMAVVKSLDQVADEAGNSPQILKKNYRKPLREEDGLAWWSLLDPPATGGP